jgi:tetratricopeptide (TPR) repeat protein
MEGDPGVAQPMLTAEARNRGFAGFWPPLLIVLAGLAAYATSFSGPFVLDDMGSIADNPTLRHLWPVGSVLSPPPGLTVSGRPLLNLTLAVNYALGGTRVPGYHAVNLAVHLLAGLVLFGIARRTLRSLPGLALVIALIWTVHPLQTESVTYLSQRAESLMGLFYLLTLYCFIRHAENQDGGMDQRTISLFAALAVVFCLLGMATKEVMVSAPLMALLYDRTFLGGSFREAWRRRRTLYLALAATWILLGYLVVSTGGGRNGSAGFGSSVAWWAYGLTQFTAIVRYLALSLWPFPQVFDYGTALQTSPLQVVPCAALVGLLLAGTGWALWRRPALGFLGCWFFLILAPTSSIVPVATQVMAEHRLYLPLAAVVAGAALGLHRLLGWRTVPALFALAAGLGWLTFQRNAVYRSEESLWRDTVSRRPENVRALDGLGWALQAGGKTAEAVAQYQAALRLKPDYAEAHNNLGNVWSEMPGRLDDAVAELREALRLKPDYAAAHNNLGIIWSNTPGKLNEAVAEFQEALRLRPDFAEAHNDLGNAWSNLPGRSDDAIAEFQEALRLKPGYAEAHFNLGNAWAGMPGRLNDAVAEFQEALRLKPEFAEAHNNLGNAWLGMPGRLGDATAEFQEALRLKPGYAEAHYNLGSAWMSTPGRTGEAIAEFQEAVRLRPGYAEAHYNLAAALLGRPGQADAVKAQLAAFLQLWPDKDQARQLAERIAGQLPK